MTVNNNNLDNRSLEEVRRQLKAALHANLLTVAARGSLAAGQLDNCEALLRENVEQARRRELSERDGGGADDQTMYEYSDELGDVEPRQVCVTRDSTRGNRSEAGKMFITPCSTSNLYDNLILLREAKKIKK
jgi:hypothetical protein